MIYKNEQILDGNAICVSKVFGTSVANQLSAEIVVFESDFSEEYYDVDEDFILGTAVLDLPENLPANAPIEVTFALNTEGILEVTGKDLTGNKEVHTTMQAKGIMAVEEVKKLANTTKDIVVM